MDEQSSPVKRATSLAGLPYWDRIVIGLFRASIRRYFCFVLAEAKLRHESFPAQDIRELSSIESHMLDDERNLGLTIRAWLVLPLWCVVKILPLKNDHPFSRDTRKSFTNKVTSEALFLGFIIWLSAALILGSVILHKVLLAP